MEDREKDYTSVLNRAADLKNVKTSIGAMDRILEEEANRKITPEEDDFWTKEWEKSQRGE